MAKVRNFSKLPKRKVTIDDLLDRNQLVDVLDELVEARDSMDELVGIWVSDGRIYWITSGLSKSRLNYLLDMCKKTLLEDE